MPEDMTPAADPAEIAPVRTWERGGDRAVLALHCSLAHAGAWSGLAERLQGIALTAFDQPGHGRASDWDGREDLHSLTTRTTILLAEHLGKAAPIDLLGHSFGATVALRVALERPDLVRSLVLVEPVLFAAAHAAEHPAYKPFCARHLQVTQALRDAGREAAAALFHADWGTGETFYDLPERQQRYIIDRIHLIAAQNDALLHDSAGLLAYLRLEALGVPVLLVEGAQSPPIIDAVQEELARRLPQARRLIVPGAGHMVPITHPDIVAHAVQAHLEES